MEERNKLHGIYHKALRQAGMNITGQESTSQLKKYWQDYRAVQKGLLGTNAPTVYQMARAYDDAGIPTIDWAREYIAHFTEILHTIYTDTMSYIYDNLDNTTHERGQLPSIAYNHMGEITNSYHDILRELQALTGSGVPLDIIAQAIADNVELDYVLGVALLPPSDLIILFDTTLEQVRGIWSQINTRIETLREQAERELW